MLVFMAAWSLVGVCADRAYGLGAERLAERRRRPGLCRRHGGAHQRRHGGSRQLHRARQAFGLWPRADAAAQSDIDAHRRIALVGGLVWLQCRICGRRRRPRRHGDAGHPDGDGGGGVELDVCGVGSQGQAKRPRHCLGSGGRVGGHYAGIGLCRSHARGDHRPGGGRPVLCRCDFAQACARV